MSTSIKWVIGGILATVMIILGGVALTSTGPKPVVREEQGSAQLAMDKVTADLGDMKSDEEKSTQFVVSNTGDTTLRLWGFTTSCDCTFAKVKIGDKEAGEFNMHEGSSMKNWMGEIPVGGKAEITVIYRPKIMPVVGRVSRQVMFSTNDPKNAQMELSVTANVL